MDLRVITVSRFVKRAKKFARYSEADRAEEIVNSFRDEANALLDYLKGLALFADVRLKISKELPGWGISISPGKEKITSRDRAYQIEFPCAAQLIVFEDSEDPDKIKIGKFLWAKN